MPDRLSLMTEGSSPLARGLHRRGPGGAVAWRIIPARAGFTAAEMRRLSPESDHPRSRGVYPVSAGHVYAVPGSSPLARGLLCNFLKPILTFKDHPRSRGVYVGKLTNLHLVYGSSPLARGLPSAICRTSQPGGIIPARAGFTVATTFLLLGGRDHPRSRGVYSGAWNNAHALGGSSPLARGLLTTSIPP